MCIRDRYMGDKFSLSNVEEAFLAWLNKLGISPKEITSILELKDCSLLIELLGKVDPHEFSTEGFHIGNLEHWAEYVANLERLSKALERYLTGTLKIELGKEYIDCLLYTSPSPRDLSTSRMPSSA
eukprot:TRINITY_DN52184_c0_g1_i1.p2 TRINITY_DN52184_c0_g1~~TRINITY_DN52184_c0_g1_i1.p2  ORF type:complete len:126 (+),score=26.19 TRINITY_DN52184_c0_g1_i1:178-555(+)